MQSELVIFDFETTSAKPQSCAVVQVGAVHFFQNHVTKIIKEDVILNEICDPGMESHHGATEVHGITPEMMIGKRPDYVVVSELYDALHIRNMQTPIIIAGHNCSGFDLPILWRIANKPPLPCQVIDTLTIARRVLHQSPGNKLSELYTWITGEQPVDAHDAIGDCRMVLAVLSYLCNALKMDIEQMAAYCAEARVLKYCTFGKHKGKLWGRGGAEYVPAGFVRWMCETFDNPGADMIATVRSHYGMRFRKA